MRFSVLSSGSKANSTFLEAGGRRILVDCGLSAKQIEIRLGRLGLAAESLDAIVVSHEHRDHIHGISVLSRRYRIPVFATPPTQEFITNAFGFEEIQAGEAFSIGELNVSPFQIVHDAIDPVGFVFRAEGFRFGHATDLGKTTPLVRDSLRNCDALVVESNHDDDLLRECEYPWMLKQRISSSHGHLSNEACAELLQEIAHPQLGTIVLAHLSENSNRPELALESASRGLGELTCSNHVDYRPQILCGQPGVETALLEIGRESEKEQALVAGM